MITDSNSTTDYQDYSVPVFHLRSEKKRFLISLSRFRRFPDSSKSFTLRWWLTRKNITPVFKNLRPMLSPDLTKLFNCYLKENCFPSLHKVSSVLLVFKNASESYPHYNITWSASLELSENVLWLVPNKFIIAHHSNGKHYVVEFLDPLLVFKLSKCIKSVMLTIRVISPEPLA